MTTEIQKAPPPSDPLAFIAVANQRGAPPEEIQKYIDLYKQVTAIEAERAFGVAMNACQAEMPTVVRDAKNLQTNSKYARLETIVHTTKPVYIKHGFSLTFAEGDSPLPGWKRTVCDLRHAGGFAVSYHIDLPLDGVGAKGNPIGQMNPVQAAVSTGTYGQRVLYCRMFALVIADTDLDGQRVEADAAAEARREAALEAIRAAYAAAVAAGAVDEKAFWKWADVEAGNFSDISPRKHRDALSMLKRKLAAKETVTA